MKLVLITFIFLAISALVIFLVKKEKKSVDTMKEDDVVTNEDNLSPESSVTVETVAKSTEEIKKPKRKYNKKTATTTSKTNKK